MTLSKQQIQYEKERFQKWFWIHERDLLWLANKFVNWRNVAHELGFTNKAIAKPWVHEDAGKLIKYMEIQ